ncbi:SIMPL domain-containing protein [Pseudolysinimonas sp.]|jgi:uncharacterized protein YggE|uniref:SIMPL domain-containing protein n=1 Tax=Pseudolysinimonas sp. TaxID=2680009 RepID=UPI003783325F
MSLNDAAETIITVQGTASDWFEAERATVSVTVSHDGPKREPVFAATTAVGAQVTAALNALEESGAVTRWSSDRVSVWSNRPWNNEGKQLAPVYYAALSASARFQDFDALSSFVEQFATVTGVTIASIAWDLTEERRLAVTTDIQTRAVQDATVKATTYARAAGLSNVTAVAIADPGMLGDAGSGGGGAMPMARGAGKMMMAMDTQGGSQLTFTPDRIEVSASVDARFLAR